jgi:tripartite-type tricarboxylate transporter receptor subunit TctC
MLRQPDVRERIINDGSEPVGNSPEAFRAMMREDLAKWAKLVKLSGAKFN